MKFLLLSIIAIISFRNAFSQDLKGIVRVMSLTGPTYIFTGRNKPIYKAKKGAYLQKGQILATTSSSTAVLDFAANGVLVLAPRTQILVSSLTKKNLRHIVLIKGEVYFHTKKGNFLDRAPGVVLSVRGFPHGYQGKEYKIKFDPVEQSLLVMDKEVEVYPLMALTEKSIKEKNSSQFDEDYKTDIDDDVDWKELLDDFDKEGIKKEKVEKKKWDLSLITRGVYTSENQFITTDATTTGENTDSSLLNQENTVLAQESFNPQENYFDTRLKFSTRRPTGKGVFISNGWLEYGNQESLYREPLQFLDSRKEGRSNLEIAEFYYQFSWDNNDISLGKKVIKTGFGKLLSIMDFITPKDLYDPLDVRDIGNYVVQLDTYAWDWTFTYALIPYFVPNKASKTYVTESESIQIQEGTQGELVRGNRNFPRSKPNTFQHFFEAKIPIAGFDFKFGAFRGPYLFPSYRQAIKRGSSDNLDCSNNQCEVIENFAVVDRYSFGFSKLLGKVNLYFETLYQNADSNKDDSWFKYQVGLNWKTTRFQWKLFESIEYTVEYMKETLTHAQTSIDPNNAILDIQEGQSKIIPISSSQQSRDHLNNMIARVLFQVTPKFKTSLNYDYSFEFGDLLQVFGLEYFPNDNLTVRLNYEAFKINLENRTEESTILTPFGNFDTSETTEISRDFDRYTLRLDYAF